MRYLLNVVYLLTLVFYAPWLIVGLVRHGKYREGFAAKLWGHVPKRVGHDTCFWLHAVSVGEVNLLGPIIRRLEQQHPLWTCVISTTTMTGYRTARQKYAPRTVFYCPLDFSWAVRRAMRRMRPDLLVLTELELWPNLIFTADRLGVPVAVINGRMSDRSFRGYRRIRWFMVGLLRRIDLIAVQSDSYRDRFLALGAPPENVHVTGSIKFDGAQIDRDNPLTRHLMQLANIEDDDMVFLAGSTQHPEESLALKTFQTLAAEFPCLRLILVPRHPERFDAVAAELEESAMDFQRRSQLGRGQSPAASARILLVDGMGELDAWWGTARIAFVGGSLTDRGGQNMIEPAAYGAAVSFGPHTKNFEDVVSMMLQAQAAEVVHDGDQLTDFVRKCLENPTYAEGLGRRARDLVLHHRGAADRTCMLLSRMVD